MHILVKAYCYGSCQRIVLLSMHKVLAVIRYGFYTVAINVQLLFRPFLDEATSGNTMCIFPQYNVMMFVRHVKF